MRSQTVRVLGAGPAGLTAAITLARAGVPVEVFELREVCGARFHGDFQGLENWSGDRPFLELARDWRIELEGLCSIPFHSVDLIGPNGKLHVARSPRAAVHVVRRGTEEDTLDQALYRAAIRAGVTVYFNQSVSPESCDLIATGPRHATGYVTGFLFSTAHADHAALILQRDLAPGGYAYMICGGGRGLVASTILELGALPRGRPPSHYRERAHRAFQERYPGLVKGSLTSFGGIGAVQPAPRPMDGSTYFAGEAAGLQDALWGFGIRSAMASGYFAARAMIHGEDYPALLEQEILPATRASIVNRFVYDRAQDGSSRVLLAAWRIEQALRGDGLPFVRRLYAGDPLRWRILGARARQSLEERGRC